MADVIIMPANDTEDDAREAARRAQNEDLTRDLAHLHASIALAMYRAGLDPIYQRMSTENVEQMKPIDVVKSMLKAMRGQ